MCRRRICCAKFWCSLGVRLRRRVRRASRCRVTVSTRDWSEISSGWLDGRMPGEISWLIEASLWSLLFNGCEAVLAIWVLLIFILKQITDERNSSLTIWLPTGDTISSGRLLQTTYDNDFDFVCECRWLYDKIWSDLFHWVLVKQLLSTMSNDFSNLEERSVERRSVDEKNRLFLFNEAFSTNNIYKVSSSRSTA